MTDEIRDDLKYAKTHEWLKVKGNTGVIGISDHAQSELTDVVYVELPKVEKEVKKNEELCVVESVKSVSEIYAPISGKIIKVNEKLEDSPELVNKSPYDEGWLVEIEIKNTQEINDLLDSESYKKILKD
jgi:glycine cleavage system H protein